MARVEVLGMPLGHVCAWMDHVSSGGDHNLSTHLSDEPEPQQFSW